MLLTKSKKEVVNERDTDFCQGGSPTSFDDRSGIRPLRGRFLRVFINRERSYND